ncbi:MAG TPA: glycoside hydrolase family 18 protein [bacterium]|nr:glycoside hydrolase family 18 protein [bacterium]HOH09059.1 glycoside hydrolase family 18 protein [bacterium]
MKVHNTVCSLLLALIAGVAVLGCSESGGPVEPPPSTIAYTPPKDSTFVVINSNRVVEGYLTPSKWYSYSWEDIDYTSVTHIVYSFLRPTSSSDPALTYGDLEYEKAAYSLYPGLADKTHLGYGDRVIARAHAANVKVLIGVAGRQGQNARDLAVIFAIEKYRKQFISNLVKLCEQRNYDGVNLDYEYPASSEDGLGITDFAQELRVAFVKSAKLSKREMFITMAVPTGDWAGKYFDFARLAKCCNWFSPMTYEFATSWTTRFGFNSPIYTDAGTGTSTAIVTTVDYLRNTRRVNPLQIVIGVPFFGWVFSNYTGLGNYKTNGNGADKSYTGLYNQYIQGMPDNGFVYQWNDVCKQPYLVNTASRQMITYDDDKAVIEKANYIKANGLKGAMIWELGRGFISGAVDPNPLLTALGNHLLH